MLRKEQEQITAMLLAAADDDLIDLIFKFITKVMPGEKVISVYAEYFGSAEA